MATVINRMFIMSLASRIATLRKDKGLSQQAMADALELHVTQVKRYESGSSQPSLEALKKLAKVLRVSIDALVFDTEELTPDEDLALQFEAINHLPAKEKAIIKELIEGMIIKYETQRWSNRKQQGTA